MDPVRGKKSPISAEMPEKASQASNGMDEAEFRSLAEEAWSAVPEKFRAHIDNVALLVEDEPSAAVRAAEKLEPGDTLLGLYQGVALPERGAYYGVGGTLPDTITLYRLPLIEEAEELASVRGLSGPEAVREAIRETLWHELGHYMGLHEEGVRAREDEGTNEFK